MLSQPDWDQEFHIATDASQYVVGAVLYQVDANDKKCYIVFASKTLQVGQRNYSAPKRELLAIIFAIRKFCSYVFGQKFRVETDHKALVYLNSSTKFIILDWLDFLLNYNFYIVYQKGIHNVLPNYLSQLYQEKYLVTDDSTKPTIDACDVAALECEDEPVEGTKRYLKEFIGNVLGKKEPEEEEKLSLVKEKHEESHASVSETVRKLFRAGYYWPSMRRMVITVCQGCVVCLKYNHGRIGFHPITPVTSALPMDIIGMDFICGLPESNEGYTIVLIVIDIASHFVILCKLISKEAESVAEALLSVFANFGVPKEIQSDQDPSFFNKVMEAFRNAKKKNRIGSRRLPLPNLIFFPSLTVLVKPRLVEHFREICYVQWKEYVLFP